MFDLNTLFSTAGTTGMLGGMGEGSPAGAGGFAGMAEGGGMDGLAALLGSIDPKTLAMIGGQTQGQQQARPMAGGGLGSPLRAGQISDLSGKGVQQAQAGQQVGARRGLGQLIYGK